MEDCWRRNILDCCSRASFSSTFILNELTRVPCSISTRLCRLSYNDTIFIIIHSFQSAFPSIFLCGQWFLFPLYKGDHDSEWFGNFSSQSSKPRNSWLENQLKEAPSALPLHLQFLSSPTHALPSKLLNPIWFPRHLRFYPLPHLHTCLGSLFSSKTWETHRPLWCFRGCEQQGLKGPPPWIPRSPGPPCF